ncbi:MAG: FG-GAP-like repeat-containing protein, partial [Akkermansiaceae bacterium]|nr:FG-GAP-like repeat-containing protein [Akkermansiaceae bacterium]
MRPLRLITTICTCLTLPALSQTTDSDGNGISDLWQSLYPEAAIDPEADSDGDGVSDRDEAGAGTNPLDPASVFRITGIATTDGPAGPVLRLTVPTVAGKSYQIESAPELEPTAWANAGPAHFAATGGSIQRDLGPPSPVEPRRFFRARADDVDADGDGLSAWEELTLGLADDNPRSSGHPGGDMVHAAGWLADHHPGIHPGGPQANLREVDVAWVRHQAGAAVATTADAVVVVGTGEWHQLSSWRHTTDAPVPALLRTMLPLDGGYPQLHFLNPGPAGLPARFVSGRLRADGNLWLSSRGLDANGNFIHYQTVGFGQNIDRQVEAYDIAHRAFLTESSVSHYVVVTPVLAYKRSVVPTQKSLRLVTWRINAQTGALTGVDSRQLGSASAVPDDPDLAALRVTRLDGNLYQIVLRGPTGLSQHWQVETDNYGQISPTIQGNSGFWNTRGTGISSLAIEAADPLRISGGGYLTAHRKPDGTPQLMVFERRQAPDDTPPETSVFRIADNELDLTPLQNGVSLTPPAVTHSWIPQDAAYDHLGNAVATGDFNGDKYPDILAAASRRDIGNAPDAGAVYTIHGTPDGIFGQPLAQRWQKGANDVPGAPTGGDLFGYSLAVGDFNSDGYDDAAIGIPNEKYTIIWPVVLEDVGAVQILYGSATGLSATTGQHLIPADLGMTAHEAMRFGAALAAGDFNGDGRADLAIGLHGRNSSAGAVVVLAGMATGLATSSPQLLAQGLNGAPDAPEPGDSFGMSLCAGNFNGDGRADLAVGVPGEDLPGTANAGAVQIYHGGAAALIPAAFVTQDGLSTGGDIDSEPEEGDAFGTALASGDFNGDGRDDLAVSAPLDNSGVHEDFGRVHVLFGTASGLGDSGNWSVNPLLGPGGLVQTGTNFGEALAAADLDGDGHADLMIGAPRQHAPGSSEFRPGVVSIVKGSATGM